MRKSKKERRAEKKKQREERKVKKLEKEVEKKIRTDKSSRAARYKSMRSLPQYDNISDRKALAENYLKETKIETPKMNATVSRLVGKGWNKERAEQLYDLVTTDVYSQFRQKYKPPSDYYDILIEDFSAADIEKAMAELNRNNDIEYKSSEVINVLYDMLIDTL